MIPGIRTFISVPAGVARMPMLPFLGYTVAGSLVWTGLLAALGYVLEAQYHLVAAWIDPIAYLVLAAIVGTYLWRLIRGRGRARRNSKG